MKIEPEVIRNSIRKEEVRKEVNLLASWIVAIVKWCRHLFVETLWLLPKQNTQSDKHRSCCKIWDPMWRMRNAEFRVVNLIWSLRTGGVVCMNCDRSLRKFSLSDLGIAGKGGRKELTRSLLDDQIHLDWHQWRVESMSEMCRRCFTSVCHEVVCVIWEYCLVLFCIVCCESRWS